MIRTLTMCAAKIAAHKERLGILAVGFFGNSIIGRGLDYVIYPFVIWKLGVINGGLVMVVVSFLTDLAVIHFYDWAKKDWLAIETLKELKEYEGKSRMARMAQWLMKKGDVVSLIFLSLTVAPFIVMVYMRHGAHQYNGMNRRDWKIFVVSTLIGNIYWTLAVFMGISLIEYIWKFFTGA